MSKIFLIFLAIPSIVTSAVTTVSTNYTILDDGSRNISTKKPEISTTYFLAGEPPTYKIFNGSDFPSCNVSEITLLQNVEFDADDFLNFLSKNSDTIESIYLYKVIIKGVIKRLVHLPNLKRIYLNLEDKTTYNHGNDGMSPFPRGWEFLQSVSVFISNNSIHDTILAPGVDLAFIVNGETKLEVDLAQGIFKSSMLFGTESILQNIKTNWMTIAIASSSLKLETLENLKARNSLKTLNLASLIDGSSERIHSAFAKFKNLENLAYSPSPFGPTDISYFPGSLKNLTLEFTSIFPNREPKKPISLENLNMDVDFRNGIDTRIHNYYDAKNVAVKIYEASPQLLRSLIRMSTVDWIYYRFTKITDKNKMLEILETYGLHLGNSTNFILKKNASTSEWEGYVLEDRQKRNLLEEKRFGVKNKWSAVSTKMSQNIEKLAEENLQLSANSNSSIFLAGTNPVYKKFDFKLKNSIKNITFMEYVEIDCDDFLKLLQHNSESLEFIHLHKVKRLNECQFTRRVYLPNLKKLDVILSDADDKEFYYFDDIPRLVIDRSLLFFSKKPINSTKTIETSYNFDGNAQGIQGVDIYLWTRGKLRLEIGRQRFKSEMSESRDAQNILNSLNTNFDIIATSNSYFSNPTFQKLNTTSVSKFVLDGNIEFEEFRSFDKLKTLIFKGSSAGPRNMSNLPKSLQSVTLEKVNFDKKINKENVDSTLELENLDLNDCTFNYWPDGSITEYFNARNVTIMTSTLSPQLVKDVVFNMTRASWFFYLYNLKVGKYYAERVGWFDFLQGFGLNGSEQFFILERKGGNSSWVGRKLELEEAFQIYNERLNVEEIFKYV